MLTRLPRRRFHDAQTITISVALGLATLYYTWRPSVFSPAPRPGTTAERRQQLRMELDSLRTALFAGTVFWLAGLTAILYPGTAAVDPEFGGKGFPQAWVFGAFALLGTMGWFVEGRLAGRRWR